MKTGMRALRNAWKEDTAAQGRMKKVQPEMWGIWVWIAPCTSDGGSWMVSRAWGRSDEV